MGKIRKVDNSAEFVRRNSTIMDIALDRMAGDIVKVIYIRIPFKSGELQKNVKKEKLGVLKHRVLVDSEYAAVQEAGVRLSGPGAPTKPFKNYTTPGTGKEFFKNAIQVIIKDSVNYFKQAAGMVKV